MDDLGAALALRLGLFGHGAEHGLGHVDLLDLDRDDLDAKRRGVAVDDGLDADVQGFAVSQETVEVDFAQHRAQGGLSKLRGLVDVVGYFDDGLGGVNYAEGDDGVYFQRDVVAGYDVLRGNLHRFLPQTDANNLVERAEDPDDAGALGCFLHASQSKDNAPLVLFEDVEGVDQVEEDYDDGEEDRERHMSETSGAPDFDHRCDCKGGRSGTIAAGLETQEKADPWLVGRSVLLDGQIVRQKVGCFEKNLAVLCANAKVGRQYGGLCADRDVIRRAGLFRQGKATAGRRPKDRCACPSRRKGGKSEVLLFGVDDVTKRVLGCVLLHSAVWL